MDTDNPNLNNAAHDNMEWWNAKRAEYKAEMDKMDAEKRLKANDALENLSAEADAAADWTEAQWDKFKAKASQLWNAGEQKVDESI